MPSAVQVTGKPPFLLATTSHEEAFRICLAFTEAKVTQSFSSATVQALFCHTLGCTLPVEQVEDEPY